MNKKKEVEIIDRFLRKIENKLIKLYEEERDKRYLEMKEVVLWIVDCLEDY